TRNSPNWIGPANRGDGKRGGMGSRSAAAVRVRRWAVLGLLALASFWCSILSACGEAVDGGTGRGGGDGGAAVEGARGARLLLSFHEAKGNASFRCSPTGPCLPCQYSEKVPLVFFPQFFYNIISCTTLVSVVNHSDILVNWVAIVILLPSFVLQQVIMVGLLLISGSVIYLRQKRTAVMPGVAQVRIPTSSPRF
ncbi:hypothetical protein BHM03_00030345, partial [Ensete ventricosum]